MIFLGIVWSLLFFGLMSGGLLIRYAGDDEDRPKKPPKPKPPAKPEKEIFGRNAGKPRVPHTPGIDVEDKFPVLSQESAKAVLSKVMKPAVQFDRAALLGGVVDDHLWAQQPKHPLEEPRPQMVHKDTGIPPEPGDHKAKDDSAWS